MDALDGFRLSDAGNPGHYTVLAELTTDYDVYPTQSAADHLRCLPWAYGKRNAQGTMGAECDPPFAPNITTDASSSVRQRLNLSLHGRKPSYNMMRTQ
jgi:hypothetical protein